MKAKLRDYTVIRASVHAEEQYRYGHIICHLDFQKDGYTTLRGIQLRCQIDPRSDAFYGMEVSYDPGCWRESNEVRQVSDLMQAIEKRIEASPVHLTTFAQFCQHVLSGLKPVKCAVNEQVPVVRSDTSQEFPWLTGSVQIIAAISRIEQDAARQWGKQAEAA